MGCDALHMGKGVAVIVCSRGRSRKQCKHCRRRPATKLCDFPLRGRKQGKTCDMGLCETCAVKQAHQAPFRGTLAGDTIDLCPAHDRIVRDKGWPKPAPRVEAPKPAAREPVQGELFPR